MERLVLFLFALLILPGGQTARGQEELWEREWQQSRTASVRVHHVIGEPVPRPRLMELESEVQRLAGVLGLTRRQLASLRTEPIEYLYLQESSSLQWFGVDDVDGLAVVSERKILASRLPHTHELVHVLAHVAISPAPGYNQPWIQEGLASYLGGHLGQSPAAVLAAGDDVLDRNPGLMGRILTVSAFRDSPLPAEQCYAASARFLHFLDAERGGLGPILVLLRHMSGLEEEVVQRPASFVEVQIEGVYDTAFTDLLADFESWRAAHPVAGLVPASPPARMADIVLSDDDHLVRWWHDEKGWVIAVTPRRDAIDVALVWGADGPAGGAWSAPGRSTGYELRLDEEGGRLIDHAAPRIELRWFDDQREWGKDGGVAWFFPASAIGGVALPASAGSVSLWSQPRFIVD